MPEAVIVATARTPIGRAQKGSLVDVRPDDMSALIIKAVLAKLPQLDPAEVEDVVWGCGQPAGESGNNIGRVAAVLAGLESAPGVTINRYCSSSLMAIRTAAHAVRAGEGDVFVAGGVETVSRFNHGKADGGPRNPRFEHAYKRGVAHRDERGEIPWTPDRDEMANIYISMGETAENVAELMGVTRRAQDEFAVRSQRLAVANQKNGYWEQEITPIRVPDGRVITADDGPRPNTTMETLAGLKPAFHPRGTVTAGNSCPLNDGAAAVVVMSDERARSLGITPLARIASSAVSGLNPEIMGLGPLDATWTALSRAGKNAGDIDLFEINEAFAAQVLPSAEAIGIPLEKLNVKGGAIALGHPYGMTGARIMTTLIHALQDEDKTWGLETMCVGGGQGMAMVIERLS